LPNHYNYNFLEDESCYFFETDYNIQYKVVFTENHSFTDSSGEPIPNTYSINVDRLGDVDKSRKDIVVGLTVSNILANFFNNRRNVVLFVCEIEDTKTICRYRKFNGWYQGCEHRESYRKVDLSAVDADINYYEHPEADKVEEAIEMTSQLFDKDSAA